MAYHRYVLGLLLVISVPLAAQETSGHKRVVLSDGNVVIGTIVDEQADPIVVVTRGGVERRIPQAMIAEILPLIDGRFTRPDRNNTRLFLAETGRTLERGKGRVSTYAIVANVAYGLTDRVDVLGGTTVPLPTDDGFLAIANAQLKVQLLPIGDFGGLAIGTNAVVPLYSLSDSIERNIIGTYYAVATVGSASTAATVGAYGFYGEGRVNTIGEGVMLMLGGEHRVSSSLKVMTENYIIPTGYETGGLISAGVRFFGDRFAVDAAAFAIVDGDGHGSPIFFSPIPYVGFSYNFGH